MRIQFNRKNIKLLVAAAAFLFLVTFVLNQIPEPRMARGRDLPRDMFVIFKRNYKDTGPDKARHGVPARAVKPGLDSSVDRNISIYKPVCKEQRNLVFIKTMKCATETVVRILRRFGYQRHLNFVLPRDNKIYLGWPYIMRPTDYRPSRRPFNMLVEHSVYNKTVMSTLMPRDTAYITIIREPYSQFKSSFHYFNVANITGISGQDQVAEYLHNLDKYETFYQSHEGSRIRYCIPDGFSVTKNLLSHCLGMPLGFPPSRATIEGDPRAIQRYIQSLDTDFTLVMIMEYFHESLVLLKRLMCWSIRDIIYRTENVGNYTYKSTKPKADNLAIHRMWGPVDYLLYSHFNETFWRKVKDQGPGFREEVALYNSVQGRVAEFCSRLDGSSLEVPGSRFDGPFTVTPDLCLSLGVDLLTLLKNRFDEEEDWKEPAHEKNRQKTTC